jgi:fatty acid desaturase
MLFGVPLFAPSFMYDGVHTLHHAKSTYGTSRDPEYLPLASMRPRATFLFVLASVLAPIGLLVRFAVLSPASVVSGRLRLWTIARYSALAINPAFRRSPPDGALRARWIQQEVAASAWSMLLVTAAVSGVASIHGVVVGLLVGSGVAVLNQIRTLAAHRWENEAGSAMSVTEQYLDSVNVPSPALLPALWAPVGLRYHALHHLLPSLPYHALASAHRRMARECCSTTYSTANARGFGAVLARLRARQRSHNTGYGRPIAPPRPDVQPGILALPQTFRPRIGDDPHRHHNDAGRSAFGICPRRDAS